MASFFDKMVEGINEGVNTVKEGSKTFAEKAKINSQIKDIERERNNIIQNIGLVVYNLQSNGEINIEQCSEQCDLIASLDQRVAELRKTLQDLEAPKAPPVPPVYNTPPAYDAPPVYNAPQPEVNTTVVNNGITCQCGMVNKEGARFCSRCGTQLQ